MEASDVFGFLRTSGLEKPRKNIEKTEVGATGASKTLRTAPRAFRTAPRALREASRRPQERSKRLQDAPNSAPSCLKTAPRALQEAQDGPKSAPRGFKTAPRALREPLRLFQAACEPARSCQRPFGLYSKPPEGLFEHLLKSSASLKVSVQKSSRRSCSIPPSSNQHASRQLAPCMSMHGFTLVYLYLHMCG